MFADERDSGERIAKEGLPDDLAPLRFVFTGKGNVSQGAQEIFSLLPHTLVEPVDFGADKEKDPFKVSSAACGDVVSIPIKFNDTLK